MPAKVPGIHLSDDAIAIAIRDELARSGILCVALVGPPGAGKTALIESTIRRFGSQARLAILTANPAAERDARVIGAHCTKVVPITTATPNAALIRDALRKVGTYEVDVLLIETMGGIASTPDLGQDETIAILSTTGGDDKAAEYRELLAHSSAVLLTKVDLRHHVKFNLDAFRADVRKINPAADYMEVSTADGTGLRTWLSWLSNKLAEKNARYAHDRSAKPQPEWFYG